MCNITTFPSVGCFESTCPLKLRLLVVLKLSRQTRLGGPEAQPSTWCFAPLPCSVDRGFYLIDFGFRLFFTAHMESIQALNPALAVGSILQAISVTT
jgi:hypothetical protein